MTRPASAPWAPDTVVVAAGRPPHAIDQPVNPPIVLSSTFHSLGAPGAGEKVYGRFTNPTWDPLEETIATLEGCELPALAYASGMAAVAAALSLLPVGGTIVIPAHAYNGSLSLVAELQGTLGLTVRHVDLADTEAAIAALAGADMAWLESPTNPMLEVADLPVLLAAARTAGVLTVVDNTFSTPLRQRPLAKGADVVVHSATKYMGGHSDVVLGAVVTGNPELRTRLHTMRTLHGAIPGPFEAWLTLRGIRTMALRLDRAEANAMELAVRLSSHPAVARVRYPGLPTDPGHQRAAAQLDGFGAILCLEVEGGADAADAMLARLELWTPATSLGGVESLAERRRRHQGEPDTVPENLVRLSVGIENIEDLHADLVAALGVGG
ncbi:trans-sulfuration enzyme family protein [Paeniglutamicibacter psychrophenolicus]|uniref:trans-sulfuration enzyme family protein n=1 Tax=Paeniglutamicibacter psychrophenolicus TaxID=257454 RepID=UPI00278BA40C|nr:aminotransferase class I/II-fold pyridoxal phosphate-dependent enzyme [Paeniglutamicibacter psychrophenolicus]MDQ0095686.1 cystathionine gamma-synthase [Paeniglutamicibacter psychrophenolicus]